MGVHERQQRQRHAARDTVSVGPDLVDPGVAAAPALATHVKGSSALESKHGTRLVMPIMSATRGKDLFVSKGCVACHAINGVGGHDAPAMDAHEMQEFMNPFDFAAKMWNHAEAMIAAQEGALGGQIFFTGEELADIIAFIHDDGSQHAFTENDLTDGARKMMAHDHGAMPSPKAHAEEVGHRPGGGHMDAPGTPAHGH